MSHRFAGFAPHFGEYSNSNLFLIGDKMVVASVGLMCGIPAEN
jgi:hypothetical protein